MRTYSLFYLLVLTCLAAPAAAQPPPEPPPPEPPPEQPPPEPQPEKPEHQRLLEEARAELGAGNLDKACDLFAASDKLSPSEDVQFELAQCLELKGERQKAADVYARVAGAGGTRAPEAQRRADRILAELDEAKKAAAERERLKKEKEKEAEVKKEDGPHFSDFIDTRLTWTFGDDDVLHETGEVTPLSPNVSIGDRSRYRLFFDNLNSRFGGRENLTHLTLYAKAPGFIKRLDTEASLVLRFNLGELAKKRNNIDKSLEDAGTFIRVFIRTGDADDDKEGVSAVFWPIDTDRFRLGYLYDISWGGTNAGINQSIFPRISGSSPGLKLGYDHKMFSVFAGFKTAEIVQVEELLTPGTSEVEVVRIGQTNYGFLGGGAVKAGDWVTLDIGGGYFQQGKFDLPDVLGEQVYTFGVSARAAVHNPGGGPGQSVDFALYRNDPMKHEVILKREEYDPDKTTWSVVGEYSNLWQNLKNFDVPGETVLQQARAAALQGNLKTGFFRASLTGIYRDLPFVLRNVPSFIPFESIPADAEINDEFFVAASVDYHFDGPKLTPGVGVGLQFPSSFRTSSLDAGGNTSSRTVVIRQQGDVSILPIDREGVPIFQARVSLKWDVSDILSALLWLQYIRDNNGTFVERDPNEGTSALRTFVRPDFFGFGTSVQARF